eukprot:TRINITY_DN28201_c0_g1_i2.p1 TRINITY_DN28201_c0_g1~~TRINITY_DN28201_c0_g1_i2.p1  ORF type:complete len:306 (+),score=50.82 TRINITY_DN28201_c0_g1_i2:102-1019(+)
MRPVAWADDAGEQCDWHPGVDGALPLHALIPVSDQHLRDAEAGFAAHRGALERYERETCTPALSQAPQLPQCILNPDCLGCLPLVPFAGGAGGDEWGRHLHGNRLAARAELAPYCITLSKDGASERFPSAEAAFQALRWWGDAECRVALAAAATAAQTARLARQFAARERAGGLRRGFASDEAEAAALLSALRARCEQVPGQAELLLATRGALLLCHYFRPEVVNPGSKAAQLPCGAEGDCDPWAEPTACAFPPGTYWIRQNNSLGRALMMIRDELCASRGLPPSWPRGLCAANWEYAVRRCRDY